MQIYYRVNNVWIFCIQVLKATTFRMMQKIDCIEQFDQPCIVKKLQAHSYYFGITNY